MGVGIGSLSTYLSSTILPTPLGKIFWMVTKLIYKTRLNKIKDMTKAEEAAAAALVAEGTDAPVASTILSEGKKKNTAPAIKEIVGELLNAEKVTLATAELYLLTIQDAENEVHTVASSVGYWEKVGRAFTAGAIIKATTEKRIANVTGYEDEMGQFQLHTSTGNNLNQISRYSTRAFEASLAAKARQDNEKYRDADATKIMDSDASHAGALASYLGLTFGK